MARPVVPDSGLGDEGSSHEIEISDDEPAYEVERIIAQRQVDGVDQYLVKWINFGDEDCTWEPKESFDQTLSISLWEEARARGDALDATELHDVESRMACRAADHAMKEAARQESIKGKLASLVLQDHVADLFASPLSEDEVSSTSSRKISSNVSRTSGTISNTKKDMSTKEGVMTTLSPISTERKASGFIQSNPKAEPAKQKQEFHGLSGVSQTARPKAGTQTTTGSGSRVGKPYRNLSHQNNFQKRRRQELAPNIEQLSTLRPAIELMTTYDVALNLPSAPRPLSLNRNTNQETFAESAEGDLVQVLKSDAFITSSDRFSNEKIQQEPAKTDDSSYRQISHAVFQHPPQKDKDMRYIRFGDEYFYHKWGEVVVQMSLGARLIGHVKVSGLPSHMITALIKTRDGPVLGMTFEQEDANDLEEYRSFSRGYEIGATGSIEPFDNAKGGFYDLLTFFNTHAKAAGVWQHTSLPWKMIAYSSRAVAFAKKGFPMVPGGLAFIVCKRFPWHNAILANIQAQFRPEIDDTHIPSHRGRDAFDTSADMEIDSTSTAVAPAGLTTISQPMTGVESTSSVAQVRKEGSLDDVTRMEAADGSSVIQKEQVEAGEETPVIQKRQERENTKKGQLIFEEKYGITYEYLTRIPATVRTLPGKGKFQRNLIRFFLAFGEDRRDEERELKSWLSSRAPAHMTFSWANEFDWVRFADFLRSADHVGIILIHEKNLEEAFSFMTGLAKRIRREDIQIFRVSLGRPLYDMSLRHFERIFPSGLVLLITEGSISANAQGTAELLDWFLKASNGKRNWRLFLRPHPEQYLRELCETDLCEEDRYSHMQSLLLVKTLGRPFETLPSPVASPDDDQASSSYVLAPLSLSVYSKSDGNASLIGKDTKTIAERDARLLDFFCGWASSQVASFRRFVAVTGYVSEDHRKQNAHVDFLTLEDFETIHIGKQGDTRLSTPKDSSMSPAVPDGKIRYA